MLNLVASTSSGVKTLGSKSTQFPTFSCSHVHIAPSLASNITATLKFYEDEIVYSLIHVDLHSFVRSCVEIISQNVKKGLKSLDNNVPRSLAIRF